MKVDGPMKLLIQRVAERIGYRAEAIPYATAQAALRSRFPRGLTPAELERRAREGDEDVERALLEAVSVGETFFFRQPDDFRYIADELAPRLTGEVVRAWSAGCATGEEAYSLAACLLATVPKGSRVEVIATDVAERNLLAAQRGVYGPWSVREAGPILHPLFGPSERGAFVVSDRVRDVTSFFTHNILDEAPGPDLFDVIFCRNVFLYFSPEAAALACDRLVSALVPGGVIAFGTLDVGGAPRGTEPIGPRTANLFMKSHPRRTRAPSRSRRPSRGPRASRAPATANLAPPVPVAVPPARVPNIVVTLSDETCIDEHLLALASIERGDLGAAEAQLEELRRRAPTYLPVLFELAVVLARRGQRNRAEALMRELLRRTERRDPHEPVPGPEELTVAYYRVAAEAYLGFTPSGEAR